MSMCFRFGRLRLRQGLSRFRFILVLLGLFGWHLKEKKKTSERRVPRSCCKLCIYIYIDIIHSQALGNYINIFYLKCIFDYTHMLYKGSTLYSLQMKVGEISSNASADCSPFLFFLLSFGSCKHKQLFVFYKNPSRENV